MNRIVRLATTSLYIDEESVRPGVSIERTLSLVTEAAAWNPDLIVLPEEIDIMILPVEERIKVGEAVPGGPIQSRFMAAAKMYNTNIVLSIREREGSHVYNTAVVIDRNGEYVGKYRKTHLCHTECDEVEQGDEYPVFKLDFGTIGVLVCMDLHYPEVWRILALQGADVIVHPAGWQDYTGDFCESMINTRAMDNQVYVVTSHLIQMPFLVGRYMGHSRIIDPYGRTRADTSHRPGVAVAEVDLDQSYEYWATGDAKQSLPTLKECFFGGRRPETYSMLTRPDTENLWRIKNPTIFGK